MIEHVIIRDSVTRQAIGVVDTADSIIWHSVWFGVGDFEISAPAIGDNLELLKVGNYVMRNDDENIGIIETVEISKDLQNGLNIVASGRFAKSILDRRIIYKYVSNSGYNPTVLNGNVEAAVRSLVYNNAISCAFDANRNIGFLRLGALRNLPATIVDEDGDASEKQVTNKNLLEYTDGFLQEYSYSANMTFDYETGHFLYNVKSGVDRSTTNTDGNVPVLFSEDFDNLISSDYKFSKQTEKNFALIGGEGEENERIYKEIGINESGLDRRELFVDASQERREIKEDDLQEAFSNGEFFQTEFFIRSTPFNIVIAQIVVPDNASYSTSKLLEFYPNGVVDGLYFKVNGVNYAHRIPWEDDDKFYPSASYYRDMLHKEDKTATYKFTLTQYQKMLASIGSQKIAQLPSVETLEGSLDAVNGNYVLGVDFELGDIVTVQENNIDKYIDVRITEITEVQDGNGYSVDIKYS